MNLDKRIKSKLDILSCFDIEKAKEFVGQKGYFANDLYCFSVVETCYYATLEEVFEDGNDPFKDDDGCYWNLFIPESFLKSKPKEKKYRPFKDINEFYIKTNFDAGDIIRVYSKSQNSELHLMLVGWSDNELILGNLRRSFKELFENFELWDGEEKFIPFGVEE
jgi:hypothetical protein